MCCVFAVLAIVLWWVLSLLQTALDEFSDWLATVSKLRIGVLGSRARSELKECWQNAISIDGKKEWTCRFDSESNVWTRLQGKYRQAVAAKSGEWCTSSSTSSEEEDRKARSFGSREQGAQMP